MCLAEPKEKAQTTVFRNKMMPLSAKCGLDRCPYAATTEKFQKDRSTLADYTRAILPNAVLDFCPIQNQSPLSPVVADPLRKLPRLGARMDENVTAQPVPVAILSVLLLPEF